jgi:hypothetical protein
MTRRKPRGRGRPTLCTPETTQKILTAIETGVPITAAAQAAGIHYATLANWQNRGQNAADIAHNGGTIPQEEACYLDFFERVARARARGLEARLSRVVSIAEGGFVTKRTERTFQSKSGPVVEVEEAFSPPDWRALAWVLERSHREFFGKSERVELSGVDGGPVEVSHVEVDALAARIRAHVERAAGGRELEGGTIEGETVERQEISRSADTGRGSRGVA